MSPSVKFVNETPSIEMLRRHAGKCSCDDCTAKRWAADEIERLRAYIWTLDGRTVCTRIDGNNFIDEGIIVASDIAPLADQQATTAPK